MLVPAAAQATTGQDECPAFDLDQGAGGDSRCDQVPHFKASFLNRVWTFEGAVDQVDLEGHSLDMTTQSIENLPSSFGSQDDALVDQDTHVTFKDSTRVYDPEGHRVSQDYLDYAEDVAVRGKLTAPATWAVDDAGQRRPTIRANRIYILDYVNDASEAQDEDSSAEQADPGADDPTPEDGKITTTDVKIWISLYLRVHSAS
jgi:hypothetical protein